MKTTVEISDSLLGEARRVAQRNRSTVKALIEEGLQKIIKERSRKGRFKLRKATFAGRGLQAGVAGLAWDRIRDSAYEGRGG